MKPLVLFVDDDANFLDSLRRMLRGQRSQWDIVYATTAEAVLQTPRLRDFGAVVLDVSMPGMNGFDLLAALRKSEETRDVPIIMLTGNAEHDLKRRALHLGATDLLNKPVDTEDLVARIASAIRLKGYQDSIRNQNALLEQKVLERTLELEQSRIDIIWRLAKVAEYHDVDTGGHVLRIALYCRAIAQALGMASEFAKSLLLTSPLHDIGMVAVPDEILLKHGKLTDEERHVMQRHCAIGAEILKQDSGGRGLFAAWTSGQTDFPEGCPANPLMRMAGSIAMTHHEKWDGSGYPMGLSGESIPIESRILALADAYDALRANRPYTRVLAEPEVRRAIHAESARHFDPKIVDAFSKAADEMASIRTHHADE